MNKSDLAKAVSEKTGLSRAQAGEAVDSAIEAIVGSVKANDSVQIAGFGTFYAKHREAREVRNPRTGETMMSKARTAAAFLRTAFFMAGTQGKARCQAALAAELFLRIRLSDSAMRKAMSRAWSALRRGSHWV